MLRTIILTGLIVVVGGTLIGIALGVAGMVIGFLIKVAIIGAIAYLALRIVSPRTAYALRLWLGRSSLPPL